MKVLAFIFASLMLLTACNNQKPLSKNEIEIIENASYSEESSEENESIVELEESTVEESEEFLEEIQEVIDNIPYNPPALYIPDPIYTPIVQDITGEKLTSYLMRVHHVTGKGEATIFEDISEINQTFARLASVTNTEWVYWSIDNPIYKNNFPELNIIGEKYGDVGGAFREDVEKTSRYLFGDNFILTHGNIGDMIVYRDVGYYTTEGYGIIGHEQPIVTSYTQEDNIFTLKVAFVNFGPVGEREDNFDGIEMGYTDEDGKYIPLSELKEYALNSPQHKIVLEQREDGSYIYRSHVLEFK